MSLPLMIGPLAKLIKAMRQLGWILCDSLFASRTKPCRSIHDLGDKSPFLLTAFRKSLKPAKL